MSSLCQCNVGSGLIIKPPRKKLDPYERLETNLDPEMTEVEVVLELLVLQTEARLRNTTTEVAPFEARFHPLHYFLSYQTNKVVPDEIDYLTPFCVHRSPSPRALK